jgi:hypothetical protein
VKRQAFAFALTANGVIASSRKARRCTLAACGPNCCASSIARGIERIKSVRRHRMPGKDRPTFGVLPRGQRM